MNYTVNSSNLSGKIIIPPSKSHTLRAILFASLANGKSLISNYLHSPDTNAMIKACQALGAHIEISENTLNILGVNGKPGTPENIIDAGNSGQVLRFVGAIAALTQGYTVLTGDASIRHNRPVQPLLDGLKGLGVFAVSSQNNHHAPIIIKGPLIPGTTILSGEDSQPVSALLIACAFAKGETIIQVRNPGELPWIDLTLSWLNRLGIKHEKISNYEYKIAGSSTYPGFNYTVPGDFSSAAFPVVAALVTQSELRLSGLDNQDIQGDKLLIPVLQTMGAKITEKCGGLCVMPSGILQGGEINVNHIIDSVPILAVLGCFSKNPIKITGAHIARQKESDRLATITQELRKMGADIIEFEDGLEIKPSILHGALVESHQDHRIAMALSVAGVASKGETIIQNIECVNKSYPNFLESFKAVGANINYHGVS